MLITLILGLTEILGFTILLLNSERVNKFSVFTCSMFCPSLSVLLRLGNQINQNTVTIHFNHRGPRNRTSKWREIGPTFKMISPESVYVQRSDGIIFKLLMPWKGQFCHGNFSWFLGEFLWSQVPPLWKVENSSNDSENKPVFYLSKF